MMLIFFFSCISCPGYIVLQHSAEEDVYGGSDEYGGGDGYGGGKHDLRMFVSITWSQSYEIFIIPVI